MSSANSRIVVATLAGVALVAAFWMLVLSPKREEASEIRETVSSLQTTLSQQQQIVEEALAAKEGFPEDYRQLVVLGKAVPADDDVATLLTAVDRIANKAKVRFQEIELEDGGAGEAPVAATPVAGAAPTEVAASLQPLGASIGPAGLAAMPYKLTFTGDFSRVARFIAGLDQLVKTTNDGVLVDGRLITVNGFSLASAEGVTFPQLKATFAVTTYLTPPDQGVTAGATPTEPLATGTPASMTTGGTP
jgi:Tfp pilus assembly protein PilO